MDFTIQELNEDGSGYMVVTRDDGSTFGQMFYSLPVDDQVSVKAKLMQLAVDRAVAGTPEQPRPIAKEVSDMVLETITVDVQLAATVSERFKP